MTSVSLHNRRGFTLVEVIVGSIILAIVASATTAAVASLAKAKTISAAKQQSMERAHSMATAIAGDAMRLMRDHDLYFTRVLIDDDKRKGRATDDLLLIVRTIEPVRGIFGIAEGADFEVQYRLEDLEEEMTPEDDAKKRMALWKRTDPALDEYQDAGGVATLLSSGIISLNIEAYDGDDWEDEWDSDVDGLPHGLRITVEAQDDKGMRTAIARRTVALDRTPIPIDTTPPEEEGE